MDIQDVPFLPSGASSSNTYLRTCGGGESLRTTTCPKTVAGVNQEHAPGKILLLQQSQRSGESGHPRFGILPYLNIGVCLSVCLRGHNASTEQVHNYNHMPLQNKSCPVKKCPCPENSINLHLTFQQFLCLTTNLIL